MSYLILTTHCFKMGFPSGSDSKESCAMQETQERSPGEGKGNPLQYSYLENSMDRRAWQGTVHGITKSSTPLRDYHFILDR